MKNLFLLLVALFIIIVESSSVFAVEYLVTFPDKTQLFRCEMHGAVFKVKVKILQANKYRVVVLGKGTTGHSGIVYADNFTAAARVGCGGE